MATFRYHLMGLAAAGACAMLPVSAQDSICARVEIRIEQELTLEREGFEARLGITNGLPGALDDFRVTLRFSDGEGNPVAVATDAQPNANGLFYHRVQTGYSQPAAVPAGADVKVAYLIVPAPGAAGATSEGTLYYIGATVKYRTGGVEETVEIAPDFIYVRPMPDLELQYFLPGDVYGDDPFTSGVQEPVEPFPLGVRIINHSAFATARKLKIQSSQPEIVDNQQGLLIDFRIIGNEVNGQPATPSLLADFGDIGPQRAAVGHWQMTASLSGRFVRFSAEIAHAPEFGGALTSLIPEDAISTHRLIGQVQVDLPGRDTAPDFLGTEAMLGAYTSVYLCESDNDVIAQAVNYLPPGHGSVTVTPAGATGATLVADGAAGLVFVRTASPLASTKTVRALRSDGKLLPPRNCWISRTRPDANPAGWDYWLNLFDSDKAAGHTYTLTFREPLQVNRAPVLTIPGGTAVTAAPGQTFVFPVSATDPDGTIPILSTGLLPDGAVFTDGGVGSGQLVWTPGEIHRGEYFVQFRASDGLATDSRSIHLVVAVPLPGFQAWQDQYWPGETDPAIIGPNADPDRDRLNNLLEYALGADPTVADDTALPQISLEAIAGEHVLVLTFLRRTDDAELRYEVVASDTLHAPLATWAVQSTALTVDQSGVPAGFERVKIRDNASTETGPAQRYLRLRVTRTEE